MNDLLNEVNAAHFSSATKAARTARARARRRYSGFAVGAAVVTTSGRVFAGCNVESASYGLTMCAERSAICGWAAATEPTSSAAGEREAIELVVIDTATKTPTPPCGACRQWLSEYAGEAIVIATTEHESQAWRVVDLLPDAFERLT